MMDAQTIPAGKPNVANLTIPSSPATTFNRRKSSGLNIRA